MPGTALQVGDPKTRPLKPKLLAVLGGAVRLLLGAVTKAGNASPIVTESWACKTWVKGEESVVDDLSGSFGNAGFGKFALTSLTQEPVKSGMSVEGCVGTWNNSLKIRGALITRRGTVEAFVNKSPLFAAYPAAPSFALIAEVIPRSW